MCQYVKDMFSQGSSVFSVLIFLPGVTDRKAMFVFSAVNIRSKEHVN